MLSHLEVGVLTVERPLIRHIVHQQYTHCPSIVCSSDCAEPLLSGGVPYLQLNPFAIQVDRADLKVDADGGDEGRCERVFAESKKTA